MARLTIALSLALAACTAPERAPDGRPEGAARAGQPTASALPAAAPLPWPTTFERPAVLMAARVVIVGPEGLREHAAIMQDPAHHAYREQTTVEGFVRRTTMRPEIDYLAPIRCRLDGLQIFAERELLVLERPGPVELSIEAEGDVYWRATDDGEELRRDRLRLVGAPR